MLNLHKAIRHALRGVRSARQRRALSHLAPHLLHDAGLTAAERSRDVRRIF